jgi:hypothetical protein
MDSFDLMFTRLEAKLCCVDISRDSIYNTLIVTCCLKTFILIVCACNGSSLSIHHPYLSCLFHLQLNFFRLLSVLVLYLLACICSKLYYCLRNK